MRRVLLGVFVAVVAIAAFNVTVLRKAGHQDLRAVTQSDCQADNDVSTVAHLTIRGCYQDFRGVGWDDDNEKYSNAEVAGMRPRYGACTKQELINLDSNRPAPGVFVPNAIPKNPPQCSAIVVHTSSDIRGLLFRLVNWEVPYRTDTPYKGGWSGLYKVPAIYVAVEKAQEYNVLIGESSGRDFCELYKQKSGKLWWKAPCDSTDPGLAWEESIRPGTIARVTAEVEAKAEEEEDVKACGLQLGTNGRVLQKPQPDEQCREYTSFCNRSSGKWMWSCVPREKQTPTSSTR